MEFDKKGKLILPKRMNKIITHERTDFNANLFRERSKEEKERYLAKKDKNGNQINKWGRKKIKIPEKIKKEVIKLYNSGLGTTKLSEYLKSEGIDITPNTVYNRLKEWKVKLRSS